MAEGVENASAEFDRCIEQFESSWRSGNVPAISDFLPRGSQQKLSAAQRSELLGELVMIDQEYRWRRSGQFGEALGDMPTPFEAAGQGFSRRPRLEEYLQRFPELGPLGELSTEVIANEYRVRHRWGDRPDHQECYDRFGRRDRKLSHALERVDASLPQSPPRLALRIRCPHCQASVELGDHDPGGQIACPSCGQRFSLVDEAEGNRRLGAGDRVGAFQLLQKLGSGSFGTVWKAHDCQLDRHVAIKLPHQGVFDAAQREQLLREARAAAQLNHPNIVPVYEVGREGDRLFIVTELVAGVNLADWLGAQRPTPRESAEVCLAIADALEHAHQHGVVHRDLKPSNIMVAAKRVPRLMDFGLAKRTAGEVTVTVEGKLLGTPAYMSPEQACGSAHKADRRSDVYALGVVLFELLTGERPFAGSTDMLLQRIVSEDAISPRRLSSNIPRDLETICLNCLEKNPDQRFQTAAELHDDLLRFLQGRPVHARPITRADRVWRWCKRNRIAATLGAVTASLLLFLAVGGPLVALREARAREEVRRQLYISDMNVALQAWNAADVRRAIELLQRYVPQDNQRDLRRFEWFYLWRLCQRSVNTPMLKHELPVTLLAFSVDGETLASASAQVGYQYEIKLWDARTNQRRSNLKIDGGAIFAAAFSPDVQTVALGYGDGSITLRNTLTGKEEASLDGHTERILSMTFSRDGTKVASRSLNKVNVWDLSAPEEPIWTEQTGETATTAPPLWFTPMAFSLDGETLAWGTTDGKLKLRATADGKHVGTLRGHTDAINSVAFSADGRTLASASMDRTARLWDVATGEPLRTLEGHKGFVTSIAFSPDGNTLATGSQDNTVKFWEVATGRETDTLKGHVSGVVSVAFSPTTDTFASGGEGRVVKLWSLALDNEHDLLEGHEGWVWSVAFSPDGQSLASGSWDRTIRLWDVTTGKLQRTLEGITERVWSVAFSPDGKTLASGTGTLGRGGCEGRVKLWDVTTGEVLHESPMATAVARSVAFSPDGETLAVGFDDGKVVLLEAATLQPRKLLGAHADGVNSVAFSSLDGTTLASGGRDNLVKLWDVQSGRHRDLRGHAGWVFSVAISRDGQTVASGSRDNTVKLWDVKTARERATLRGHSNWVMCVAFAPDGETLLSGDSYRMLKLWDVATERLRVTLEGHRGGVFSVAFSPTGNTLASGDNVNNIRLWRAATKQAFAAADEWRNH